LIRFEEMWLLGPLLAKHLALARLLLDRPLGEVLKFRIVEKCYAAWLHSRGPGLLPGDAVSSLPGVAEMSRKAGESEIRGSGIEIKLAQLPQFDA
jgi:hypothetical protein